MTYFSIVKMEGYVMKSLSTAMATKTRVKMHEHLQCVVIRHSQFANTQDGLVFHVHCKMLTPPASKCTVSHTASSRDMGLVVVVGQQFHVQFAQTRLAIVSYGTGTSSKGQTRTT